MKNKFQKIIQVIIILFLIVMIFEIFYQKFQFMKNYKFANGIITETTKRGWKNSGDYSIIYHYQVAGKNYKADQSYNLCNNLTREEVTSLLLNKKFAVAYSDKHPSISSMIITQESAERFKYKIPDSLLIYDSILTCK